MAKRKVTRKNSQRRKNLTSKVPNPFRRFSNVTSTVKNIPWNEKTLLVAFLLLMGIVAFSTNGERLNEITGSFVQVTGEQTALDATKVSARITSVFTLITEGLATPIFGLLSRGGDGSLDDSGVLFVKILLIIILYFILAHAGLGSMFGGKGKFIAGVISFLGIALLPSSIIQLYIVNLIPNFLEFLFGLITILFLLIMVHRVKVESRAGHVLKAIFYLLLWVLIPALEALIFGTAAAGGTQAVEGLLGFGIFREVATWTVTAAWIYTTIMIFVEIVRAGRRDSDSRAESPKEAGKALGETLGAPGKFRKGIRKGLDRERPGKSLNNISKSLLGIKATPNKATIAAITFANLAGIFLK